ncbi:MAG: TetR family transcriptional regulator C-terminal domain-containing protein [Acidiferrobacter sp.]
MRRGSGESTRNRLLAAAACEFHEQGFQAARLSRVLARAGVTKGALYHHFPDKRALGVAVIDEIIGTHIETMWLAPLRASGDPVASLTEVVRSRIATLDDEAVRLGCPLNNLIAEMSATDAAFKDHLQWILRRWQDQLVRLLAAARGRGALRDDVDCEAAALFILSSWEGCWGIAKNMQSVRAFRSCGQELLRYIGHLAPDPLPMTTTVADRRG